MKSRTSQKEVSSSGTATFRFDGNLLDSLKEEAEQKRTSLNTLVSQILLIHSEYHTFAAKGGMVSMPKNLLVRIIDKLSPQEVIQLSENIASNELKDTILLMKNEYSANSILDFIESWARVGGYPYRHHVEDAKDSSKKKHSFVLQHDMGERWSLYFVEMFKYSFKQVNKDIHFENTKNTISFDVEV